MTDEDLIAEIPPAMRAYLREYAKRYYFLRLWQTLFFVAMIPALLAMGDVTDLDSTAANVVNVLLLILLAYCAFGFALIWPERWERRLLKKQLDYRRAQGKWRWHR